MPSAVPEAWDTLANKIGEKEPALVEFTFQSEEVEINNKSKDIKMPDGGK